jgi:glutathione synthase/RimK-type ligase-like ATP-grasp enzyme
MRVRERREKQWQYDQIKAEARGTPCRTSVALGIIKDSMLGHARYEIACLELGVPYRLIDIAAPDWIQQVQESGCSGFIVRPSPVSLTAKRLFDDRLKVLAEDLGKVVFPSFKSLWLYESKIRIADWLSAHAVPHPRTWIFWDRDEAMGFAQTAELPMLFKTDLGAAARGVELVRSRRQARRLVATCFGKGYRGQERAPQDREWGWVLFQQYIPDAKEWRMVRVGDSYFGHRKLKSGDFHSGSQLVAWDRPPDALLDLTRDITELGGFLSMDIDVLEDASGRYYVNEMHAMFGQKHEHQMIIDGRPGRFVRDVENGKWCFEEGSFCRNKCYNLRVQTLLALVAQRESGAQPEGDDGRGIPVSP